MKHICILFILFLSGCSPSWSNGPYEVYWIDGNKTLGYNVGDGAYIGRIDEPKNIQADEKYISVYACPDEACGYYYIDKANDHKFADSTEFVFGPYTKEHFLELQNQKQLPMLDIK